MSTRLELLTAAEMAEADRRAAHAGVPSLTLMENAGRAVADLASRMTSGGAQIVIACGPGNNGGDGFVAARLLAGRGCRVRLHLLGPKAALKGDAAVMSERWRGPVEPMPVTLAPRPDLIIDALFGAGLSRPLAGAAADAVAAINESGVPILAVDVPSGLDGTTGVAPGPVVKATRTVTFFRRKPGHVLLPGRELCGRTEVADIGIPATVLEAVAARASANAPPLWIDRFPRPTLSGHKYTRGHALVVSGPPETTGAARLGARAALRIGAGLVTLACPRAALPVNAAHLTAVMVMPFDVPDGLGRILEDKRKSTVLIGPGAGTGEPTRRMVSLALAAAASAVLDADALTAFAAEPDLLFAQIAARADNESPTRKATVLTPHEGEFQRLFGSPAGSKLERAQAAAQRSGAIVVLKGPDTVIADPSGLAAINENAPPWLATAGSGDVLAGLIAGLLAQRMPAFAAACAGVWLHGECALSFGPGLIAEDLPEALPSVLRTLLAGGPLSA